MTIRLGIIGGGVMAEAILSRLLAKQVYQAQEILVIPRSLASNFYKIPIKWLLPQITFLLQNLQSYF